MILSEGLNDVLARIDSDFAASGCDSKEVNNPFGSDAVSYTHLPCRTECGDTVPAVASRQLLCQHVPAYCNTNYALSLIHI